jgi:hypothetical protein
MNSTFLTPVRHGLALLGFALALLSIAYDSHRLGWTAIGALGASFLLRLVTRKRVGSDRADGL